MNKLGIKVYGNNVYEIDDVYCYINSINYQMYTTGSIYKFRLINQKTFGISLYIEKK